MSLYFHCDNPVCHRKAKPAAIGWEGQTKLPEGWKVESRTLLTGRGMVHEQKHFCPKHSVAVRPIAQPEGRKQ